METKIRVLIADPNEDFQLMMSEILGEEEDITVVGSAGDGLETLARLAETDVDLLLMDLVLPKLDGLGVLRKLPELRQAPAVLILTGFVNSHVVAESADLGASYFISKPCDTAELLSHIRQFGHSRPAAPHRTPMVKMAPLCVLTPPVATNMSRSARRPWTRSWQKVSSGRSPAVSMPVWAHT